MNTKTDINQVASENDFWEEDTSGWGTREGLSEEMAPEPKLKGWECASVQRTLPGSL